jgi:hypothetical protein
MSQPPLQLLVLVMRLVGPLQLMPVAIRLTCFLQIGKEITRNCSGVWHH